MKHEEKTPKSMKLADAAFKLLLVAGGFAVLAGFSLDEFAWKGIGGAVMVVSVLGIILTRWARWWRLG